MVFMEIFVKILSLHANQCHVKMEALVMIMELNILVPALLNLLDMIANPNSTFAHLILVKTNPHAFKKMTHTYVNVYQALMEWNVIKTSMTACPIHV
jgi:hypothetical protein